MEFTTFDRKYTGIAKFPAVTRDISMVVPKHILVGQIEDIIEQRGGRFLESYKLFDIYEGARSWQDTNPWHTPSPSGQRTIPWRIRSQRGDE